MPLKPIEKDFTADSSGFSTSRFDRWYSFKYGREISSRAWVKAHLMSGVKTNVVTAVKITEGHENDSPQFEGLLENTAKTFEVKEVSADKGYISIDNLQSVENHGGIAYIPYKSNARPKANQPKIWKRMFHYFMFNREEFLQHYHKRSNAETVFHMIKSKFGDSIRSKEWASQANEVLLKILCHNICVVIQEMYELGIKPEFCN